VTTFIKLSKTITPAMSRMFPIYPQYFKKHKKMLGQLFLTLNQYILHGQQFFKENPQFIVTLI